MAEAFAVLPRRRLTMFSWGILGTILLAWTVALHSQDDLTRRLTALEAVDIAVRIKVLETQQATLASRLDSIESLGRGILLAVSVQLLVSGLSYRKNRS